MVSLPNDNDAVDASPTLLFLEKYDEKNLLESDCPVCPLDKDPESPVPFRDGVRSAASLARSSFRVRS